VNKSAIRRQNLRLFRYLRATAHSNPRCRVTPPWNHYPALIYRWWH
jgi:hypothetical protein